MKIQTHTELTGILKNTTFEIMKLQLNKVTDEFRKQICMNLEKYNSNTCIKNKNSDPIMATL